VHRRDFIRSLSRIAAVFSLDQLRGAAPLPVHFVNVAREPGLKLAPFCRGSRVRATEGKWIEAL
jgi:hypothetical protein